MVALRHSIPEDVWLRGHWDTTDSDGEPKEMSPDHARRSSTSKMKGKAGVITIPPRARRSITSSLKGKEKVVELVHEGDQNQRHKKDIKSATDLDGEMMDNVAKAKRQGLYVIKVSGRLPDALFIADDSDSSDSNIPRIPAISGIILHPCSVNRSLTIYIFSFPRGRHI